MSAYSDNVITIPSDPGCLQANKDTAPLKILVAIASYGTKNNTYLSRVIEEYRSMPYSTDVVVVSNIDRDLGADIKVVVGLPSKDPWSLPFAHKALFAQNADNYDLFIYSEDDVLLTQRNIEAFLKASKSLRDDELPGFFRYEEASDGRMYYPDVHWNFHWESTSVCVRGEYTCAFFTNEHAACYILTRQQLDHAIRSKGFVVQPHRYKYDLLVTAATDPYTQCGFTKLICVSHFDDFLVHHMPNRYVGTMSVAEEFVRQQIQAILASPTKVGKTSPLLATRRDFIAFPYGKNYYEAASPDLLNLIPETAQTVLSVGCGWGATEESLLKAGKRVVAVATDPIIAGCAKARGVEVIDGDFPAQLAGQTFDCVLITNLLHLVEKPQEVLATCARLLSLNGTLLVVVPDLGRLPILWRQLRGTAGHLHLGNYSKSGVHRVSRRTIRRWMKNAGLRRVWNSNENSGLLNGIVSVLRRILRLPTPAAAPSIIMAARAES
jgi:2-polyprenyl-3-methyl-5-hydroxy-6-metoxy-1,4-benzoquinol methylase